MDAGGQDLVNAGGWGLVRLRGLGDVRKCLIASAMGNQLEVLFEARDGAEGQAYDVSGQSLVDSEGWSLRPGVR